MRNILSKGIGVHAIAAVAFMLFAQAQVLSQKEMKEASVENTEALFSNPRRIEGVWDTQVTIRVCATEAPIASFPALGIFGRGGTFHDTNSNNPSLRSATFGTWSHIWGNRYRFAFKHFNFDAGGNYTGWNILRHQVSLNVSGNQYTSAGTVEIYDVNGTLIRTGCSSSTATRFD